MAALRTVPAGTLVVAEKVTCPPWMPRRAVATLHGGLGVLRGLCAALGLRLELVAPQRWQERYFGPPPPHHSKTKHRRGSARKDVFVHAARKRWPDVTFLSTWGHADAAWLALYGFEVFATPDFVYGEAV